MWSGGDRGGDWRTLWPLVGGHGLVPNRGGLGPVRLNWTRPKTIIQINIQLSSSYKIVK
jgi:hypothetical protein